MRELPNPHWYCRNVQRQLWPTEAGYPHAGQVEDCPVCDGVTVRSGCGWNQGPTMTERSGLHPVYTRKGPQ